jgi:hypothetical protein
MDAAELAAGSVSASPRQHHKKSRHADSDSTQRITSTHWWGFGHLGGQTGAETTNRCRNDKIVPTALAHHDEWCERAIGEAPGVGCGGLIDAVHPHHDQRRHEDVEPGRDGIFLCTSADSCAFVCSRWSSPRPTLLCCPSTLLLSRPGRGAATGAAARPTSPPSNAPSIITTHTPTVPRPQRSGQGSSYVSCL